MESKEDGMDLNDKWMLQNEELRHLYRSLSIVRAVKYRRFRWTGHVARTGKIGSAYKILVGEPTGKPKLPR
jgi:hypothetical protein